jgi:hypothetical protein
VGKEQVSHGVSSGVSEMDLATQVQFAARLSGFKAEIETELEDFKQEVINWMLGLLVVHGAAVVTFLKLLPCK